MMTGKVKVLMTIKYQGEEVETDAATVLAFVESRFDRWSDVVVEYNGQVLADRAGLDIPLEAGAELNLVRIVSGG